ncbi:fimbria/pilus periplasmic chaperone [Pseudomonas sp. 1912-s]|uniref:fimbrial biogenesis chaperone n=1 Tax=Pseudomonas sp. 1912-s TaxID=3033802 RepID=UPI0023DE8E96|nr:fimbria/pilus periplasmic chaperone [Pseudomonas sp. 1912-s]MDF3202864.1 fimbria/pilus periplasmic chaperone [Pseudomonas sp. 1912-s]
MNATLVLRCVLLMALISCSSICLAGIQVGGTRIIFPASDREATIQVRNEGSEDTMIQSWIEAAPGQTEGNIPFAITPSLARLSYKKQQSLRIFYQGKGLPVDRESVFWLSVQEIPQLSGSENTLQVAFRQRLKVFYRPLKLPGSPDESADNLKWRLVSNSGKPALLANNASAYHVSLGSASLVINGKEYMVDSQMVNPNSTSTMTVNGLPRERSGSAEVRWESVNDFGALVKHQSAIQL